MRGGFNGKILNVDLTARMVTVEALPDETARLFIGTYGLGARLLYERMKPGVDPLGPESLLGFVTGPLTGTGAMFGGRFSVVCKSPVNGGWNDANCGGHFGPELKKAGFDIILISGIADQPVYLWIQDRQVEIREAGHLWGKECPETEEILAQELGDPKINSVVIGPPGENCAWMAAIMNDKHRAAGRGGVGAVMGSKKLKAIAVRGTGKIPVANDPLLQETNRFLLTEMKQGPSAGVVKGFGQQGTGMGNLFAVMSGDTPIKNWGGAGTVDFAGHQLEVGTLDAQYKIKRYACSNCPMGCGAEYDVKDGSYPTGKTQRAEYETMGAFGGMLLNEDPQVIIKCNDLCNRYGLDTISTGATIAWAMECAEHGLFSAEEMDGLELSWGNGPAIVALTQAIAETRGIGRILANGSQYAAKTLNRGFEFLQVVRGMEFPMHDPKANPGYARTYQIDPTPARHVKGGLWLHKMMQDEKEKYDISNSGEPDKKATSDIEFVCLSGMCQFIYVTGLLDTAMKLVEAATGWTIGEQERLDASLRSLNIRQAFNLREGILPRDSVLPERMVGNPPPAAGPQKGRTIDAQALARNFFQAMEWDEVTGKPSRESLERLGGLEDVIRDLYG